MAGSTARTAVIVNVLVQGLWVKVSLVLAVIWLVVSIGEVPNYSGQGRVVVVSIIAAGAAVIVGFGLAVQWIIDYIASKSEEQPINGHVPDEGEQP